MNQEFLNELCKETFIQDAIFLNQVDSSNLYAQRRLEQNTVSCPALVFAENQTAGRGRGSNPWWSNKGALTFSIIFEPEQFDIPKERWPLISLGAAIAVSEVIEQTQNVSLECQLKWPNDVFLQGQKLAGILVEIPSFQPSAVIVGIGININNSLEKAPKTIQEIGISLVDILKEPIDRMEVLKNLLYHFKNVMGELASNPESLISYWRNRCWLTHRTVTIQNGNDSVSGTCQGIDDDGGILLITQNGLQKFHGGIIQSID